MPPTIRIFFALELTEAAKSVLGKFLGELKRTAKSNSIRWSKLNNLHITLQFMPEVQVKHLPELINSVRAELLDIKPSLFYQIGGIYLFPSPYRPRVIVLNIAPQAPLTELSVRVGRGITALQYDIENRSFRAHMTIGRIKHADINLQFLSQVKVPQLDEIAVENVVVYRSDPHADGSQYTVLEKIPLFHHPKNEPSSLMEDRRCPGASRDR